MIARALWTAAATVVPLVLAVTVATYATPHARGISFALPLRYSAMAPACALAALTASLLFAWGKEQPSRSDGQSLPLFYLALFAVAVLSLAAMALVGPRGLVRAAAPAVVTLAATLALLVPRLSESPPRLVGSLLLGLFGLLEVVGLIAALRSDDTVAPGPNGMAFEVPRRLFDVDHKFVDLKSGGHVHYVDEGTGPTLLFLHGNPAWSFQWRALIAGLRGQFRCVALDYPGFGLSTRAPEGYGFTVGEQSRVTEELVDRLGLKDITLVMQDWGGPIGLGLAERRPELVRSIVLGNTWAWPTKKNEPRGMFSLIAGGPIGEFAQMNFNGFASFGIKHGVVKPLTDEDLDLYLRPFRPLDRRGVAAFYPGQITDATDYMTQLEAGLVRLADRPALIFWGTRDAGFPRADLERFERAFPRHVTFELDADHFFFEDAADTMIVEIGTFASLESARTGPVIGG